MTVLTPSPHQNCALFKIFSEQFKNRISEHKQLISKKCNYSIPISCKTCELSISSLCYDLKISLGQVCCSNGLVFTELSNFNIKKGCCK